MSRTKVVLDTTNNLYFLRSQKVERKLPNGKVVVKDFGIRELEHYTAIKNTIISVLENEKARTFRQEHIDVLTSFFNVTSDFLLGNSEEGIKVYTLNNNEMYISKYEYLKLKDKIKSELILWYERKQDEPHRPERDEETGRIFYKADGFIKRTIVGDVKENEMREVLEQKYINIGKRLTAKQLEKVIKLIEELFVFND